MRNWSPVQKCWLHWALALSIEMTTNVTAVAAGDHGSSVPFRGCSTNRTRTLGSFDGSTFDRSFRNGPLCLLQCKSANKKFGS